MYLGTNKNVYDLYRINTKNILLKYIKQSLNKQRNIVMMSMLPKLIYTFKAISSNFQGDFFKEFHELILKFIRESKIPQIAKAILKQISKEETLNPPDIETYYKAIQTAWY